MLPAQCSAQISNGCRSGAFPRYPTSPPPTAAASRHHCLTVTVVNIILLLQVQWGQPHCVHATESATQPASQPPAASLRLPAWDHYVRVQRRAPGQELHLCPAAELRQVLLQLPAHRQRHLPGRLLPDHLRPLQVRKQPSEFYCNQPFNSNWNLDNHFVSSAKPFVGYRCGRAGCTSIRLLFIEAFSQHFAHVQVQWRESYHLHAAQPAPQPPSEPAAASVHLPAWDHYFWMQRRSAGQ